MKYRLLTVKFKVNYCTFTKMVLVEGELSPESISKAIESKEGIVSNDLSDILILNSMELTREEALTFKTK